MDSCKLVCELEDTFYDKLIGTYMLPKGNHQLGSIIIIIFIVIIIAKIMRA